LAAVPNLFQSGKIATHAKIFTTNGRFCASELVKLFRYGTSEYSARNVDCGPPVFFSFFIPGPHPHFFSRPIRLSCPRTVSSNRVAPSGRSLQVPRSGVGALFVARSVRRDAVRPFIEVEGGPGPSGREHPTLPESRANQQPFHGPVPPSTSNLAGNQPVAFSDPPPPINLQPPR